MSPLIRLEGLTKTYVNGEVETPILHGIDLEIPHGAFVSLMGPSGSGKSTLMHILGFLDRLSEGDYWFNGTSVRETSSDQLAQLRSRHIGFVFQAFNLLPGTTVLQNVMLPMMYSDAPPSTRLTKAKEAIASVGLTHRENHLSGQLSGGERQRVAIARALINDPELILADEPTGNLDTKSGSDVLQILQDLHAAGRTIVMVTHELEAAEYAERIVRLRDGRIESDSREHTRRNGAYHK